MDRVSLSRNQADYGHVLSGVTKQTKQMRAELGWGGYGFDKGHRHSMNDAPSGHWCQLAAGRLSDDGYRHASDEDVAATYQTGSPKPGDSE